LVGGKFGIDAGELDIDRGYAGVNLYVVRSFAWSMRLGLQGKLTLDIAESSVGLGAVLFAPNRRFIFVRSVAMNAELEF
jgi:hypothetical protein